VWIFPEVLVAREPKFVAGSTSWPDTGGGESDPANSTLLSSISNRALAVLA
jgi:hypothetical protein